MKTRLKYVASKIDFWNLFIGIVIGFGLGVYFINALIPNANELIRIYRLDRKSMDEDRAGRKDGLQGTIEINGN